MPGADAGNAGKAQDDVVDAEFTEVKDDKKSCPDRRGTLATSVPFASGS